MYCLKVELRENTDIPLSEDLGKLEGAVSHGGDEVEGDAGEAGRVDVLVQALQEVVDHPRWVAGDQHVSSIPDRQRWGRRSRRKTTESEEQFYERRTERVVSGFLSFSYVCGYNPLHV